MASKMMTMSHNQKNGEENERTSLLASASAPGGGSPPSSPDHAPLEEMERDARRLAGRCRDDDDDDDVLPDSDSVLPDSDSVNGLLDGFGDDEGGAGTTVTPKEMDFLAAVKRNGVRGASGDGKGFAAEGKKSADDIGDELLGARDNPELERRILHRSLRLDGGSAAAALREQLLSDDDWEEAEDPPSGTTDNVEGRGRALSMSERVHESTCALRRASVAGGGGGGGGGDRPPPSKSAEIEPSSSRWAETEKKMRTKSLAFQVFCVVALTLLVVLLLSAALALGTLAVGPPRQPVGEYRVVEAQVGEDFWGYYDFYAGKDSVGSNGYIEYVSREVADEEGIARVVTEAVGRESMIKVYGEGDARGEEDWLAEDLAFLDELKRKEVDEEKKEEEEEEEEEKEEEEEEEKEIDSSANNSTGTENEEFVTTNQKKKADRRHLLHGRTANDSPPPKLEPFNPDIAQPPANATNADDDPTETFVLLSSSPTALGPRRSLRLHGRRRFNRGLFVIDLRHMPAGCGTWPAFWLTDEANWPVNGEIDIVEGVSYQNTAKTALHSTKTCTMDDVPALSKTGSWDTAVGVPDGKTGVPDMTFRQATNCFVYDPHQWVNQGCVATDLRTEGRSLGGPLNANGGGVYALEWDPMNRHIRSWVFSPHAKVPRNLREALRTATGPDVGRRVAPDTDTWGLPYGYFPIGEGTNCPSGHFRNMRLVINLAFCGSVAGNRYWMDCPAQRAKFDTCEEWVASEPDELKEAYWKIRGVYVFERAWARQWT